MLLVNSIICNHCYDRLISRHRHDYKTCKCGKISLDGGLEYAKILGEDYIDASITNKDSHDKIRANFEWGSYGKDGNEGLHYIKLCDMSNAHLGAILDTQKLKPEIKKVFHNELLFRIDNFLLKNDR